MSKHFYIPVTLILVLLLINTPDAKCQFYNGHQMSFGKNRVQYRDFVWQFYRFKKFDTYFYQGGKELAKNVSRYSEQKINEYERYFEYALDKRIIFILYNSLSDFRQSNIGLITEDDQYNIGGTTKIIDNKVFIYYEGDKKKLEQQISAAIVEILLDEYLEGSDLKSRMANSTLLALPEWYKSGLISFLSKEWDYETENRVKDGVLSGKYEKFNHLSGEDAVYAGHSIWYFIAQKYGKAVIPNILYLTRVSKNTDSGFMYVLGTSLKYLSYEWLHYFDSKYYEKDKLRSIPDKEIIKTRKTKKYDNIKISPDKKYIAYTDNELGQYRIWIYNTVTNKKKKILKKEHKLDQITDYSYPKLAWHPKGNILSFIIEEKGSLYLYLYNIETKKTNKKEIVLLDKVLDYEYSQSGHKMIMSAVRNAQTDIYIYNVAANSTEKITYDNADDRYPRFINKNEIIFNSNRQSDTLITGSTNVKTSDNHDIFLYNIEKKQKKLTRITNTPLINEQQAYIVGKNLFCYKSDENGIVNRHIASYDSTIAYIDTSVHFRYFTVSHPVSNYSRNILTYDISTDKSDIAEILYYNNKYRLFATKLNTAKNSFSGKYFDTSFKKHLEKLKQKQDSAKPELIKPKLTIPDKVEKNIQKSQNDTLIDINNYVFDRERKRSANYDNHNINKPDTTNNKDGFRLPKQRYYFTSFYSNYLVNQVDFGFLNQSYQPYTGGAVYYNPGFNVLLKLGTNDLMEDYRITGGFRFSGSLNSNEYILSFENLKQRIDKQLIFHRQTYIELYELNAFIRTTTHEIFYITKYPLSQVARFDVTAIMRYDKGTPLSGYSINELRSENIYKYWSGIKGEYVFDNTRNLGTNLYSGSRYKLFAEAYKEVMTKKSDLFVLGMDIRHYQKIHRNLIWASRIAASTSFGNSLLLYYLGSVDNWMNLSTKVEIFDQSIKPNANKTWAFQTLATDMRGFTQNVRNGNNFALINNEIRWPFIKYFANRPINSDFLNTMQLVGFFDIGTAWTGKSPLDDNNSYNTDIHENGPITIIIDKEKSPFVYGFGAGLRSRLLGYFVRIDWAWGIDSGIVLPKIFYLSLSLDF